MKSFITFMFILIASSTYRCGKEEDTIDCIAATASMLGKFDAKTTYSSPLIAEGLTHNFILEITEVNDCMFVGTTTYGSNFNNHVTMSGDLMVNSFNNLKVSSGRTLTHQLSMDVSDAWELDDDGNYMPAPDGAFVIDPRFKVDKNGNIHLRKEGNELWTDDVHTYFE